MLAEFWRKLWTFQWKYAISYATVIFIFLLGGFIDYILSDTGFILPKLPYNFYIIFLFGSSIIFFFLRYKNHPAIQWLSSTPSAISAISGYSICLFCMGFFPQIRNNQSFISLIGLQNVKHSYIFLLINLYVLTCLAFIILKRIYPFTLKNLWFLLNHFGLLLVIISTGLGSSDLKRVDINLLEKEEQSNIGIASNGDMYQLPFTLKLLEFSLDEFNPKIVIVDTSNSKFKILLENDASFKFQSGQNALLLDWFIIIKEFSPNTYYQDSVIMNSDIPGSCPAAYIDIINYKQKKMYKGWISTGSYNQKRQMMHLQSSLVLTLINSNIVKQSSRITILKDSIKTDTILLANNPIRIGGWTLYQAGYDKSKGKWSTLSVIEAINDPWGKFSLIGIVMVITGMLSLLIFRVKKNN